MSDFRLARLRGPCDLNHTLTYENPLKLLWRSILRVMEYDGVLRRLLEIERAIGVLDALSVRRLVMETQEYVLQCEKNVLETLRLKHAQS